MIRSVVRMRGTAATLPSEELETSAEAAVTSSRPDGFHGKVTTAPGPSLEDERPHAESALGAGKGLPLMRVSPALGMLLQNSALQHVEDIHTELPIDGEGELVPRVGHTPLIGVPNDFLAPGGSYEEALGVLKKEGIPRQDRVSRSEQHHEDAFAGDVEQRPEAAVQTALALSRQKDGTYVFEVDAMKRLYEPYGSGGDLTDEERKVRLTQNHALHPTATVVARLAFLMRLDELQKLPTDHPQKKVFVTAGGCAAGKGSLLSTLESFEGKVNYGAIWDAAGEGNALENPWVLEACVSRGIPVVFGFTANDPLHRYEDVLARAEHSHRVVDPVTFADSYVEGVREMKKFLASDVYRKAREEGLVATYGAFSGRFDTRSLEKGSTFPAYPERRPLGEGGILDGPEDIPEVPPREEIIRNAISQLTAYKARQEANGRDPDEVLMGALGRALKVVEA